MQWFSSPSKTKSFTGTSCSERPFSLAQNDQKVFINKWSKLINEDSRCIWTQELPTNFELPIRHGEGKVHFNGELSEQASYYQKLLTAGEIAPSYAEDENGSYKKIAGICDPTGKIFGLMPHPEAAANTILRPSGERNLETDIGLEIFKNGVSYAAKHLEH